MSYKGIEAESAIIEIISNGDNDHVARFTDLKTGKSLTPVSFGFMRSKLGINNKGLLEELQKLVGQKFRLIKLFTNTIETPRNIYTNSILGCAVQLRDTNGKFQKILRIGVQKGEYHKSPI